MGWSPRKFDWEKQLEIGNSAQDKFFRLYADSLTRTKGNHSGDFKIVQTGETIELKSDQYTKTNNFFIERWSKVEDNKVGGPWQAITHGSKYYVYWFPNLDTMYVFLLEDMVKALDQVIISLPTIPVSNSTYTTVGYKVPKELLISEPVCIPKDNILINRQGYIGNNMDVLLTARSGRK